MNWEVRTMRSVTSYFNSPLFTKNMTRFWPVWAGYGLLWMFLLPMKFFDIASSYSDSQHRAEALADLAAEMCQMLTPGVAFSAVFGLVAAMAVFSYLFSARSAYMMHSLPFDRNTLFFTNYISGLAFLLLPHLAVFAATLAVEMMYGCAELGALFSWLWVQSATVLFFYSFAVFCAMFTGNLLALPAFYGILNFLVMVLSSLMNYLLEEFYYGYWSQTSDLVMWLTPFGKLCEACDCYEAYALPDGSTIHQATVLPGDPAVVLIYAAVGLALTSAALWVYHRRHVESAGDVVAIPLVRPVFKVGVALCAGLCFGMFSANILSFGQEETSLLCFAVFWTVVGAFVADMLLQKSFRVLKYWKSAAALGGVMCVLFAGVKLDWFGYESRVPDPNEVENILITSMYGGAPYDRAHYGNGLLLTEEAEIKRVTALHQAVIHEKDRQWEGGEDYADLYLHYTLHSGETVSRRYVGIPLFEAEKDAVGSVSRCFDQILQDRALVRQFYEFDLVEQEGWRLSEAYLDGLWSQELKQNRNDVYLDGSTTELYELWQAVQTDFEEGTIGVRYLTNDSRERLENTCATDLTFVWHKQTKVDPKPETEYTYTDGVSAQIEDVSVQVRGGQYITITLTPNATNTLRCLEELADVQLGDEIRLNSEVKDNERNN